LNSSVPSNERHGLDITMIDSSPAVPVLPAAAWRAMLAPYVKPCPRKATFQLLTTGLPFLVAMAAMLTGLYYDFLPSLVLLPVGACLLVRLFIIQHDCGHGSFLASSWANGLIGRILSLATLTPYTFWRRDHAMHHTTTGDLGRRGWGDVTMLTVDEYRALPFRQRMAYRLYRHPAVMFGLGPVWLVGLCLRVPRGNPRRNWRDWSSIVGTDLALAALVCAGLIFLGPVPVLLGWLPVSLLAAAIGIWLFYVQHQFEHAYWNSRPHWDFHSAALLGSSFYDLPAWLHWLTGNIGFHHVHHLASRIPNYRLRECHESHPVFRAAPRLTLRESLRCARLALWDTEQRKLVPFG
jgi:omega-6 fatty acid desaturase (delta-12 desaturase)